MSDTVPTFAFDTVLIANRGEIALRIMHSCRQLGLATVAVYSDADQHAPHRFAADRAMPIGAAAPKASYLNIAAIIAAAKASGAQAVHPGYGFLAENAEFARAVTEAGLIFIGPPADAIAAMGNKAGAKAIMQRADVPCIPGYQGSDQSDAAFIDAAKRIGYPVMIKAAAGGGGRGMRRVDVAEAMLASLQSARSEALNSFGDAELILEKAVIEPRHIEIQVFADTHGNVLHLGERDCSVQRRHQKVIEEAPSPVVTPALRAQMGAVAVAATRAIGYVGAGTLEFLLDGDGKFYFMEMNTRLQVEHAVTESVLGVDLVAWQLQVAQGGRLPLTQAEVDARFASGGHAIEVRLCAEDPAQDFLPQSGPIAYWQAPPQVRCEHALVSGGEVSPHYDSMLAKIVAHGATRDEAVRKLARALTQTHLLGIASNREFLGQCLAHPVFRAGQATTGFIASHLPAALRARPKADASTRRMAAALIAWQRQTRQPQRYPGELIGWASSSAYPQITRFELDGEAAQCGTVLLGANRGEVVEGGERIGFEIQAAGNPAHLTNPATLANLANSGNGGTPEQPAQPAPARQLALVLGGVAHPVLWLPGYFVHAGRAWRLEDTSHLPATRTTQAGGDGRVTAPMNGRVVSVAVKAGDEVVVGQTLLVLEAMKMEHAVLARVAGVVEQVLVEPGGQVGPGALVVQIRTAG